MMLKKNYFCKQCGAKLTKNKDGKNRFCKQCLVLQQQHL